MYKVTSVVGDKWGGEFPREAFRLQGITYEANAAPKSDIYRDALPLLNSGTVELLDIPRLTQQLIGLERKTARSGKDTIDHAPLGHDDCSNAVCLVITLRALKSSGAVIISDDALKNIQQYFRRDAWRDMRPQSRRAVALDFK
jgi:hypothetical protein